MKHCLRKICTFLYCLIMFFLLLISFVGRVLVNWYKETFDVGIDAVIYTIKSPLKGADTSFLKPIIIQGIFSFLIVILLFILILCILIIKNKLLAILPPPKKK